MKSLKIFLKKSSCGCTAKTRKNKRSQNKRKSNSKRKNYRGGYKALNTINDEKFSLSSSSMHRKSKGRSKRASASQRRRS